jgi:anthranilate phosphoribosyltransferase
MIKEAIGTLISGRSLSMEEASSVMQEIMDGSATQAQMGAFLVALRLKGETSEEVAGMASVMRSNSTLVQVPGPVIDIVGTGGDGSNTFNISTTAAFVLAGAGLKVAKHGNRAMSSRCGSADVLEALGVRIDLSAEQVRQCIDRVGIGFMFAQTFHPSMRHAAGARREIGVRTVFNVLGPLTNPARAEYQVIGVPTVDIGTKIAHALCRMSIKRAMVVCGCDGMDELSASGKSALWEVCGERIIRNCEYVNPEYFGLRTSSFSAVAGGTPQVNAAALLAILRGERSARRDVVLLNAAAGIYTAGKSASLGLAIPVAEESIDSGKALEKLQQLVGYREIPIS